MQSPRLVSADHERFNTFGLASQLRTPPLDPSTFTTPSSSIPKLSNPRSDSLQQPQFAVPTWSALDEAGARKERGSKPASRRPPAVVDDRKPHEMSLLASRKLHPRPKAGGSRPLERSHSAGAPSRPARPISPSYYPLPDAPEEHRAAMSMNKLFPSAGTDWMPQSQPLDLAIKMDSVFSTYQSAKSTPNLHEPQSPHSEQIDSATAKTAVATRVSRGGSLSLASGAGGRKASVAALVPIPIPRPDDALPRAIPRPPSTDARPIGQGPRASYHQSGGQQLPLIFRRSSSVYIPNPSSAPPPPVTISPGMTLVSLARRTSHLSSTPGYGWRLHLLEKLETVMGAFLTISEAEEILSIGSTVVDKPTRSAAYKANRKSQIGIPPPSPARSKLKAPSTRSPATTSEPKAGGFFRSVKRALVGGPEPTSPTSPTFKTAPLKPVFGVSLDVVAEYGFVTSMIAGQRHDLPGVCFSSVEEIYRRGQGPKIPGLFHSPGEASRVAKLVDVFNSAPDYGERHDMSIESIHNVTALLKKYLRDLPEPILDHRLWRLYLTACVDSTSSLKRRIASAQLILRLLPSANFSLLVYLVAFLSQTPLFPENHMALDAVAALFGASTMGPRTLSTAARFHKLVSSHSLSITGPTDTHESGVSVKKAQDGLLWLLTHWSLVADGLLEPDFDIDTDEVLDRSTVLAPVVQTPKPQTRPSELAAQLLSPIVGSPAFPSPASFSPSSPLLAAQRAESLTSTLEIFGETSSTAAPTAYGNSPPVPRSPSTLQAERTSSSSPSAESTPVLSACSFSTQRNSDPTDEPVARSPELLSASDESTSDDKHSPLFATQAKIGTPRSDGFARATPEDEFGPLGPNGTSVLDDLLDSDSSLYNFPSPPTSVSSPSPLAHSTSLRSPTSPMSERSSLSSSLLVRTNAEQFLESQQLLETSRREIQRLWAQLTEHESARTVERAESARLREEPARLAAQLAAVEAERDLLREDAETRRQEAEESWIEMEGLKNELVALHGGRASVASTSTGGGEVKWKRQLDELREELRVVREQKDAAEKDAAAQIASLRSQLDTIRSVLGGSRL